MGSVEKSLADQVHDLPHLHGTYSSRQWPVIHEAEANDVDRLADGLQKATECLHDLVSMKAFCIIPDSDSCQIPQDLGRTEWV